MKKLDIVQVFTDGIGLALKNFVSLLLATVLYVITAWIPYFNVGTTIAMASIPVELSKGKAINPLFIFDGKYRKNMGEFFILIGLELMAFIPALMLGIIPAIVLSYAWSLALLLFIDKGTTALDALRKSNELTYGNKWRIFGIKFVIVLAVYLAIIIIMGLFVRLLDLPKLASLLTFIVVLLINPIEMSCNAIIYKHLACPEAENTYDAI